VLLFLILGRAFAAAPATNPVYLELDKAKTISSAEHARARAALIQAIDAHIKTTAASGDLDALKSLTSQKDAFTTVGVLPNAALLKDAVTQYSAALRKADGQLVVAYEAAIQALTDTNQADEAKNLRRERQAILSGAAASDGGASDMPEAVLVVFERSKSDYLKTVADARKAYLDVISSRMDAATRAGDLNGVTQLRTAKSAVEADHALPEGIKDSSILGARTRFASTVQTANTKLATAYREAIRGFTRARQFDQATGVQAEMNALGLGAPVAPAAESGAVGGDSGSRLARILPSFIGTSGTYSSEKNGIRLAPGTTISTKSADFLTRNFVFDLEVFHVKQDGEARLCIGDETWQNSIQLVIGRQEAILRLGEQWGKNFGRIHPEETYTLRIERRDGPITVSIGSVINGKFVAELTRTISDPKKTIPGLNERRAKIYFAGSDVFAKVRLATGAAAAAAEGDGPAVSAVPVKLKLATPAVSPAITPPHSAVNPPSVAPTTHPVVGTPPATPPPSVVQIATVTRSQTFGGKGGKEFAVMLNADSPVIGFNVSTRKWAGHRVLASVEPVFLNGARPEKTVVGRATDGVTSAVAKNGYAIGGLVGYGGDRVDGFKIVFMRLTPTGLDPNDSYESEVLGGSGGKEYRRMGGGKRVIGIFGRCGEELDSIGLVLSDAISPLPATKPAAAPTAVPPPATR
jgi:hypothetical protein